MRPGALSGARLRRLVDAWPLAIIVVGFAISSVWTMACLWLAYYALDWALN